MIGSDSGLMI